LDDAQVAPNGNPSHSSSLTRPKQRIAPMSDSAIEALTLYLTGARPAGGPARQVFVPDRRAARVTLDAIHRLPQYGH
jgi:hypothetical protein